MIRVLDQNTIDKIAAGEVIERPMSVVKELVENSIDAGATRITVEIRDGGKRLIRVTDNGSGIDKDDVRRAYVSHATSKITEAEDITGVMTLGFRGEALSTIAAVTETEMVTKTREAETGIKYVIRGGKEIELREVASPDGTTIIAENIFYNTPARLKFLKSNMTEGSYINDLMIHTALANPEIAFKLISNDKVIIDTSGNGNLQECIYSLYGRDIARSLIPVDYTEGEIHVWGYAGKPFLSKGNRSFENYYVNKRYIKNAVINKAIEEAYKTYVMQHKFPFVTLFLEMPPESCDINVHPAKREFRFENEKLLFTSVYHAVLNALKGKELIPDMDKEYKVEQSVRDREAVRYEARKSTTDVVNEDNKGVDSNQYTAGSSNYPEHNRADRGKTQGSDGASGTKYTVGSESHKSGSSYTVLEALLPDSYRQKLREIKEEMGEGDVSDTLGDTPEKSSGYTAANTADANVVGANAADTDVSDTNAVGVDASVENTETAVPILEGFTDEEYRRTRFEQMSIAETGYITEEAMKDVKVIGLVFNTYWITEYDGNMFIMDQHAAHEKVNYETFLEEFKRREVVSQQLYPPMVVSLSSVEKSAVMDNLERFTAAGFELEDFGGNDVKLSSVPVNLLGLSAKDVFLEFAAYLASGTGAAGLTEDIFIHKLATMGCKAAVKGNQRISAEEVAVLLKKLLTLDNPYTCPHGRPTIIKMSMEELDKKFKRIVD